MPSLRLRATASALFGVADTNIVPVSVTYDKFLPRVATPTITQWNDITKQLDFITSKLTWLSRAGTVPSTWVTLTEQGSEAANKTALQNAINAAVAASGTTNVDNLRGIRIPASMSFDEDVSLNAVSLTTLGGTPRWLYIETADGTLRGENQRVSKADDAAKMPKHNVRSFGSQSFTMSQNTDRVRLTGLHMRINPANVASIRAGSFGYGNGDTWMFNGFIGYNPSGGDTRRPRNIIIDRCVIEGDDLVNVRRTMRADFQESAIINCWIECAGETNSDSQGILISSTPGDIIIWNNEIATARGQCVAIAGDPLAAEFIPTDWIVAGNLLCYRRRWGPVSAEEPSGLNRATKSAFQTKVGVRGAIVGNRIKDIWGFGQQLSQFHVIVIKASDDNNNEPWATCHDIYVAYNDLVDCAGTITLIGTDKGVSSSGADHRYLYNVDIAHNINRPWALESVGRGYIGDGFVRIIRTSGTFEQPGDSEWSRMTGVSIRNNSIWIKHNPASPSAAVYWDGTESAAPPIMIRFEFANNVIACENVIGGWFFTAQVSGAFSAMPTGWNTAVKTDVTAGGNFVSAMSNPDQIAPWTSSVGVATFAAMDVNTTTLALNPSSPGKNIALGGGDPGVDFDVLAVAQARSATGRG